MADKPSVSVITPFLNAEKFIQETVESVFAQTYDNWELLLADDGSTDASTDMARHYAQERPERVRYLEHQGHANRGASASHNMGIRHAKGKYVAMLDADDVWLPHKLQRQVALLESHPEAAMTYGPSQWWYSWTGEVGDRQRDYLQTLCAPVNTPLKPSALLCLFLQQQIAVPVPSAVLVKRDVVERVEGWEETCRTPYIDQVFYAKICLDELQAPVLVDSACYCKYRRHPDSLCAAMIRTGQGPAVRLAFLTWLAEYMSRRQVRDDQVRAALQRQLWPYRHPILQRISKRGQYRIRQVERLEKRVAKQVLPVGLQQRLRTR
jgi:glycosyltransferase involved in cell wall biosynthesis